MKELSQQDLVDKTGVSKRSISRLEQGESVQVDTLVKILLALDLGENIELLVPNQSDRPSYYLAKNGTQVLCLEGSDGRDISRIAGTGSRFLA